MLKRLIGLLSLFLFATLSFNAQNQNEVPIPTQAQLNWQNAELAALGCIDLHSFDGKFYIQKVARVNPIEDYNIFNPQSYDTDQWVKSLKFSVYHLD